jgi:FAD/FMN-containing dehydrogenase
MRQYAADVAVAPQTPEQVAEVLGLAYEWRCPVTIRGGGTGNYGQAVPMHGGILLLTHRLDQVLDIGADAITVQAGCRLGDLARTLGPHGLDLRILPSTYLTSSVGGFVAGGTGGIGSITWGVLYDGNVGAVSALDLTGAPTARVVSGEDVGTMIHTYGTVGVITELTLPVAPLLPWSEAVYTFPTFEHAADFAVAVTEMDLPKRLVSVHEWPVPSYFTALERVGAIHHGRACVLLEAVDAYGPRMLAASRAHQGFLTWAAPPAAYHRSPIGLSNFSFNHTTLVAKLADPALTYLQVGLDVARFPQQITAVKASYPHDIVFHVELMRSRGRLIAAGLPLFPFHTEQALAELMDIFAGVGATVINPHTHLLDLKRAHPGVSDSKRRADPRGLLNPGKVILPDQSMNSDLLTKGSA